MKFLFVDILENSDIRKKNTNLPPLPCPQVNTDPKKLYSS